MGKFYGKNGADSKPLNDSVKAACIDGRSPIFIAFGGKDQEGTSTLDSNFNACLPLRDSKRLDIS